MAAPVDAYPLSTRDSNQIRLDLVKPVGLYLVNFNATTGTAPLTNPVIADGVYSLVADADCIIDLTAVATLNNATVALFLQAGERAFIQLPANATGFSALGTAASGRLYIQQLTSWSGLINPAHIGNF